MSTPTRTPSGGHTAVATHGGRTPSQGSSIIVGGADAPFDPHIVDDLLRTLGRTVKNRQLYLPNNPIYQRSLDSLRTAFETLWKETEEIVLAINETDFRWEGATVGAEAAKSDSLAWLFY